MENEVDGPTLVSLNREELKSELGIQSLPARRYLWDLIENTRSQQQFSDHTVAIQVHQTEIDSLNINDSGSIADAASGGISYPAVDPEVIGVLRSDAELQRQIFADHLLALRLQGMASGGQQVYEDCEMARQEQQRLQELAIQSEYDHIYAASIDTRGRRRTISLRRDGGSNNDEKTLFERCIDVCVHNRINVSEALRTGRIQPIEPWSGFVLGDEESKLNNDEVKNEKTGIDSLPHLTCSVCYEDGKRAFALPCNHNNCTDCMRRLCRTALADKTLLPLKCCELPIDMTITTSVMIELRSGCFHMTCSNCNHEFCYRCLRHWDRNNSTCPSGQCELWDEDMLQEAAEARVNRQGVAMAPRVRLQRVREEMNALRTNEECLHEWTRQDLVGECERCGYDLWMYGMVCEGGCNSTVCYTCAHHRIPSRGWR